MAIRDLIPWSRGRGTSVGSELAAIRSAEANPFLTLHREMNRLFDDVLRRFDQATLIPEFGLVNGTWPNIEVSESDDEVTVTADLPGLEEKDISVELSNDVLTIKGERNVEQEENGRLFSERYYGRFERQIPVEGIDPNKIKAHFKNGLLTVSLPRSTQAKQNVRRIAIN
jgi:HSP20 family protein